MATEHHKAQKRDWYERNKALSYARTLAWQKAHPERKAAHRNGVDPATVPPKPQICDVCAMSGRICLDLDHATGLFRGWLCEHCNRALGAVRDDPALLLMLADYLSGRGYTGPST
jgi:hypothetical protein